MHSKFPSRDKKIRLQCLAFEDRINPTPLFTTATPYQITNVNNNNGCVATADFNHDGFQDAVLTDFGVDYQSGAGTQIIILYGNSSGGFSRVTLSTGGSNVSFVNVVDINGDGWADLAVTNENHQNAGSISIFRNDGAGNLSLFNNTTIPSFSNNPSWVGTADVTGDGVQDLIVASFGRDDGTGNNLVGNNMTIFQGNADATGHGNFTFSATPITTLFPSIQFIPTSAAVADFDGDGIMDIAAAVPSVPADTESPQPNGNIYLFRGTGGGGFAAPNSIDSGGVLPVNLKAVDLNNDSKMDLVIANAGDPHSTTPEFNGNAVGVSLNVSTPGNLTFGFTNSISSNCYGTFATAIADFNLDGHVDIAAVNYGTQTFAFSPVAFVAIYLGSGTGTFPTTPSPATYNVGTNGTNSLPGGQYLAVGDFDHNGTPDLIVAQASFYVGKLLNNTAPAAAPHVTSTQVNDGNAQRSRVTSLRVTFDTQVTFSGNDTTGAFTLTRNGGGAVSFSASASVVGGVTVVTLSNFTGSETDGFGSLNDGRFTLTALASHITANGQPLGGGTGTNYTFTDAQGLFRMFGDYNGDANVNGLDLGFFRGAFGTASGDPNYIAFFDFNGDGAINGFDFGQFKLRFGTSLP
jgi:hypothetical protein